MSEEPDLRTVPSPWETLDRRAAAAGRRVLKRHFGGNNERALSLSNPRICENDAWGIPISAILSARRLICHLFCRICSVLGRRLPALLCVSPMGPFTYEYDSRTEGEGGVILLADNSNYNLHDLDSEGGVPKNPTILQT